MNTTTNTTRQPDTAFETLEQTPLGSALGITEELLDHVMATAYQLYRDRRYSDAEILCRGLLATDPGYWWCYSLYGAILRRQGRLTRAITMFDRGLRHEPDQPKLIEMRAETIAARDALLAIAARDDRADLEAAGPLKEVA